MSKLCKATFEKKDHGRGAGIPVLKTIWDLFDLKHPHGKKSPFSAGSLTVLKNAMSGA
jgi:hypothetical protein